MTTTPPLPAPTSRMVKHELRRRILTVETVARLTPAMLRLTLTGEDLHDFASLGFDDHIKLFVPDGAGGEAMRDYTPRAFSAADRRLILDFAVHEAGPATAWALSAAPGDALKIGGPRGSRVIEGPERWLLIGDETALPAIGRKLEELPAGQTGAAIVAVPSAADEQDLPGEIRWLHRAAPADPAPLLDALRETPLAPGTFVWIAAEAQVARALKRHLIEERGHAPQWLKAAGYWTEGRADAADKALD